MPSRSEKMWSLCEIMNKVHALADYAWPRDGCDVSAMPNEALPLIMDIHATRSASAAAANEPANRAQSARPTILWLIRARLPDDLSRVSASAGTSARLSDCAGVAQQQRAASEAATGPERDEADRG